MKLGTKRITDAPAPDDGVRLLVDRYWPRGVEQERARIDAWVRELAPSPALIAWYGRKLDRWTQFKERYWEELRHPDKAVILDHVRGEMQTRGVTLLSAWRNREQNPAQALAEFLAALPAPSTSAPQPIFSAPPALQATTTFRYYPAVPGLDWFWLLLGLSAPIISFLTIQFVLSYRQPAFFTIAAVGTVLVFGTLGRFLFRQYHLGLPEFPRSGEGRQPIWVGILSLALNAVGVVMGIVLFAALLGVLADIAGIFG